MDFRDQKYYYITFDWKSLDMRTKILKVVTNGKVKFFYNNGIRCTYMISVPKEYSGAVEYELRKAERNDDYCFWKEAEQWKN